MPEKEEKQEGLGSAISAAIIGALIFAIIGAILSIFPIVKLGVISSMFWLIFFCGIFGFCLGFIYGIIPEKNLATLVVILLLALVVWFIIKQGMYEKGLLAKAFMPLKESLSGFEGFNKIKDFWHDYFVQPFECLKDPSACYLEEGKPATMTRPLKIDMQLEKKIEEDKIRITTKMNVLNRKIPKLIIRPRCFLKEASEKEKIGEEGEEEIEVFGFGSYSKETFFEFPKSEEEMHTQFSCSAPLTEKGKIIIKAEIPLNFNVSWPVWLGKEPRIGLVKSIMSYDVPYSVTFLTNNDMPFEKGKKYEFWIEVKKKWSGFKLRQIDMEIRKPKEIEIDCEGFEKTMDGLFLSEAIETIETEKKERIIYSCTLEVMEAKQKAVKAFIQALVNYEVYVEKTQQI